MMKKLLVFLVMISVLVGTLGMVMATESQDIGGDVQKHVEFTLTTTSINYGSLIPGETSEVKITTLNVAANNNVDFNMDITLTSDPNGLFQNIYLENTGVPDSYTDQLLLDTPVTRLVIDSSDGVAFDTTVNSVLKVPLSAGPITGAIGTVTYTISATQP